MAPLRVGVLSKLGLTQVGLIDCYPRGLSLKFHKDLS